MGIKGTDAECAGVVERTWVWVSRRCWAKSVDSVPLRLEAIRMAPGIVPSLQAISNRSSIDDMFPGCRGDKEERICRILGLKSI